VLYVVRLPGRVRLAGVDEGVGDPDGSFGASPARRCRLRQKILLVRDVEYLRDSAYEMCSPDCPYYPNSDLGMCRVLGDRLELGEEGLRRSPRCLAAAGNHNILGKCLEGE
jgi:hypothetical protein